jgi:glycosyltransferase involved in cell wall biosynthesis
MAQQQGNRNGNIKILSVVWYKVLPAKFGGQKAVAFFNEHLGRYAKLVCICSANNIVEQTSYKIDTSLPTSKAQFFNPFIWIKIYRLAKLYTCTHLILEFPYHGIAGVICKKLLRIKLIVNTHNIEYLRFKEQKKWWWRLLYYYERWTLKSSDFVFFKTDGDKTAGVQKFMVPAQKTAVVPYGATEINQGNRKDANALICRRHDIKKTETIILFAGTLDYQPNAEAVLSIAEKLIPLLNQGSFSYKIIICGRNHLQKFDYLSRLENEHLVMAGEVADIETYFLASAVFINPVLTGGGVQTKIIDALSHHLNVVCFDSRGQGIAYAEKKIFTVEDGDWKALANAVIKASANSYATEAAFFAEYNWNAIADKAYQKLATL